MLVGALVLAPFAVVAVRWIGADWFPSQDFAVLDLRMRALLSADTPLTGAFSRYGWNHPGPVWYWILAPLYLLTGQQPWSLVVGGALYSAGVLALGFALASRLAGSAGALCFGGVAALTFAAAAAPGFAQSPWNPYLALTTLLTLLVAVLVWAGGSGRMILVVGVLATVLVQLHVGYILLLAPILLWGGVRFLRNDGRERLPRRTALITAAALAVLWAPAAVDAALRPPGNLYELAAYTLGGGHADSNPAGFAYAAGVHGYAFKLPPPWITATEQTDFSGWVGPSNELWLVIGAVLAGGAWLLARRGAPLLRRLVELALVSQLAALVALSRVAGERWSYLFIWRFALAALLWVAFAAALWVRLGDDRLRRLLAGGAFALVALLSVEMAVDAVRRDHHVLPYEDTSEALTEQVLDERADRARPPTLVALDGDIKGLRDGILNGLRRADVEVRAPVGAAFKYGRSVAATDRSPEEVWLVTETSAGTSLALALPGARVLGMVTPLDPPDEAHLQRLSRSVALALHRSGQTGFFLPAIESDLVEFALGGTSAERVADLGELARLNQLVLAGGQRAAVVALPGNRAPRSVASLLAAVERTARES
jgi:hypothetical protein